MLGVEFVYDCVYKELLLYWATFPLIYQIAGTLISYVTVNILPVEFEIILGGKKITSVPHVAHIGSIDEYLRT